MCRDPIHCIIPPYMAQKIQEAGDSNKKLFSASTRTRFNDELFRKKRALLTEMNGRQMKKILSGTAIRLITALDPEKKTKKPGPVRKIYDARNTEDQRNLPGVPARNEGEKPVKDKDVNNIYDNCGYTWNFYYNQLQRDSIDGKGLPLINSVHFGKNFGNAFWEGTQMVFGDGDEVFRSFTEDIDITGHELTHGVVQYEAQLEYAGQSGAINESMADVFGMMIRQFALGEDSKTSDWLIGRTCIKGKGYALRSMKAPGTAYVNHPILGTDPQPATMKDYISLPNNSSGDYGGVHLNSGIVNHAFYLVAVNLGQNSWDKAGKIWYDALCDEVLLNEKAQFTDLRNATITTAEKRYGTGSNEATVVKQAWTATGL